MIKKKEKILKIRKITLKDDEVLEIRSSSKYRGIYHQARYRDFNSISMLIIHQEKI